MKKEWKIFLTAIMYFTRIRVPKNIGHDPVYLQKAPKYFPLVGWIVAAGCSLAFLVFARFTSPGIGILASMITGILITGAFHEDGFADVCDGFGGGWTKEKILLIMKDSRIGAFGAIGLICILVSKFLLLQQLFLESSINHDSCCGADSLFSTYHFFIPCLFAAHSLSRLMPVLLIQWSVSVTDADHSKSRPVTGSKLDPAEWVIAIFLALAPFIFLSWHFLLIVPATLFTTWRLAKYFKKWIGGYTGDCLGAIQQVSEIVFYLGTLVIWKAIHH
jgi:adenosylcobinamide-GDP ribazoletransferase